MGQNRQGGTGRGRISRQRDRQRAGRKAERWTGWFRQAKGRRISIKMDRMGQNRQADRQAKGRQKSRKVDRMGQNRQADSQATGRQKSRKVERVGQTGRLKTQ
jgi:hypothetical protein